MSAGPIQPEVALQQVNVRLAALLHRDPLPLKTGAARALEDPLWVWGVLGGKDVGKSTLIDALAGTPVSEPAARVGEGTYRPTAFFHAEDDVAVRRRFEGLPGVAVEYCSTAGAAQQGLVLVDLPDFDSLFERHSAQVREIARVLDGIIWMTTPKKVGDVRAIQEMKRVLKDRTNFVYVVNKIDWLVAQSNGDPRAALRRTADTLQRQIEACAHTGADDQTFLISARHPSREQLADAIQQGRTPTAGSAPARDPDLQGVVDDVVADFRRLRTRLTSAPTPAASAAHKRANLAYQVRAQAQALRDHFEPQQVVAAVDRVLNDGVIAEETLRAFPAVTVRHLAHAFHDPDELFAQWSTLLFKRRITAWPMLGLVAWPLALIGTGLAGLRRAAQSAAAAPPDPFRCDGISLADRLSGLVDNWRRCLAGVGRRLPVAYPDVAALEQEFRVEVSAAARAQRTAAIAPYLERTPARAGRIGRWALTLAIVLWFPIIQPVLAALLGTVEHPTGLNLNTARALVAALSGHAVLAGLAVSAVLLLGLVAAVYSGAVRDSFSARDALRDDTDGAFFGPIVNGLTGAMLVPLQRTLADLRHANDTLDHLTRDGNL